MTALLGYCDAWSAVPGDRLRFMVSCAGAESYRAEIVRLRSPQAGPHARPFREDVIDLPENGDYPARVQPFPAGSFVVVPAPGALDGLDSFTAQAFVWPTLPGDGEQAILGDWSEQSRTGFGLFLDASGAPALRLGKGDGTAMVVSTGVPLAGRHWYLVAASYDAATGTARVLQRPHPGHRFASHQPAEATAPAAGFDPGPGPLLIAAWHRGNADAGAAWGDLLAGGHFNGKIDRPRLARRALGDDEIAALAGASVPAGLTDAVVAAWDFGRDIASTRAADIGPHGLDGEAVNLPARAMAGHNWSGRTADWRQAPEDYGAIHFHDDDIYDCRWRADVELTLPADLDSGVYAARLRAGEAEYRIPFFVRPPRGTATADIAYLAPTATYLAYANGFTYKLEAMNEATTGALTVIDATDLLQWDHPGLGYSTYDVHRDGSGVCYSSRLRPVLNLRPTGRLWNFPIDMFIVDWLEHTGLGYDVVTDEDVEAEGAGLLAPYRVVVTGSHPEYYSLSMLDSLEAWQRRGGRLMYMGGNGFYWRVAFHPELPGVMEVRRAEGGIRTWAAEPGEYHHSFSGELGGLWRRQRRPPNMLCGVGFISQGFDAGSYYRRAPGAEDARAAFIFEGVGDAVLGDFGACLGGAASLEIDCVDAALGTPAHALVLASSERHSNVYELVPEEMLQSHPMTDAPQNPAIRADMVFFETPGGGAVFSTGSIGYAGSLGHRDFDNSVARLTTNVLRRFADPAPFALPGAART